jgi:hypothetical protein
MWMQYKVILLLFGVSKGTKSWWMWSYIGP